MDKSLNPKHAAYASCWEFENISCVRLKVLHFSQFVLRLSTVVTKNIFEEY